MKFAMNHPKTRQLLETYDVHPWKIASYFFHDRGSLVQKSVEGLAREILYQILYQDKSIFMSMFEFFNSKRVDDGILSLKVADSKLGSLWFQNGLMGKEKPHLTIQKTI